MYEKIRNHIKFLRNLQAEQKSKNLNEEYILDPFEIQKKLEDNLSYLKSILGKSNDIVFREFKIGIKRQTNAFICFVSGLVDKDKLNQYVIRALMTDVHIADRNEKTNPEALITIIKEQILSTSEIEEVISFNKIVGQLLSGNTILFIDGYLTVLSIGLIAWAARDINEPDTESNVRGSREGFVESLHVNISQLRRRIKNPNLIFESFIIGKQTHTDICIVYIQGIANIKIINEVKRRLNRIDTDSILESGYIEQYIEDNPFSPFATVGNSEKPDKVAAKLLEGRVAILCDGTPFVLTVPQLFIETFQSAEDYYSRPYLSSLTRLLRLLAFFITLSAPAIYIALSTFHQEMVPSVLLISMGSSREGIPFPTFVETLLMSVIFELLRESGIRMPRSVGQAVSIVGALVIGDAAVNAGIVGAPMVIVTALTGITSFIIPAALDGLIFFRFFLILLSGVFGMYGIAIGLIVMLAHMCSLRSFGAPYLSPFAPTTAKDLKDTFIRAPLWLMKSRPKAITWKHSKRQKPSLMPNKPDVENGDDDR